VLSREGTCSFVGSWKFPRTERGGKFAKRWAEWGRAPGGGLAGVGVAGGRFVGSAYGQEGLRWRMWCGDWWCEGWCSFRGVGACVGGGHTFVGLRGGRVVRNARVVVWLCLRASDGKRAWMEWGLGGGWGEAGATPGPGTGGGR